MPVGIRAILSVGGSQHVCVERVFGFAPSGWLVLVNYLLGACNMDR